MAIGIRGSNGVSSAITIDGDDVLTINESTGAVSNVTAPSGSKDTKLATTEFVSNEKNYSASRTYELNEPSFFNGVPYRSLQAGNINHSPDVNPTWWEVTGGGSGIGSVPGINFDNGQFDAKQITGWSTYNDGASAVPVDGTGGTATIGFAHDTTNPLVGTGMAKITKTAVNEQGEGISYPFTVDLGARNTPLKITFQYLTEGTTYADGDIGCYVYDVTNATLLYPSIVNIPASGTSPAKFESSLWLNANSGSYRLIFHVQSTSALAYTFKLDNIQIEPLVPSLGAVISEWRSFTPAISGGGTATFGIEMARKRRVGSSLEIEAKINITASGSGASSFALLLPDGLYTSAPNDASLGDYTLYNGSIVTEKSLLRTVGTSSNSIILYKRSSSITVVGSDLINGNCYWISASIPISQWSANTNLVEDFTEYAYNTSTSTTSDTTSFGYGSEGALIQAFAPSGVNVVTKRVNFRRPIQTTDSIIVEIRHQAGVWVPFEAVGYTRQFDNISTPTLATGIVWTSPSNYTVDVNFCSKSNGDTTWASTNASGFRWRVRKISNGNTAEVPPVVRAEYTSPVVVTPTSSFTTIQFDTKVEDTHNAVTIGASWRFTAPVSGVYLIESSAEGSVTSTGTGYILVNLLKLGIKARLFCRNVFLANATGTEYSGSATIRLLAGEYISLSQNASNNINGTFAGRFITITRIGG